MLNKDMALQRNKRLLAILAAVALVAAGLGYAAGEVRAEIARHHADELPKVIQEAALGTEDNGTTILDDPENGQVCATSVVGRATGSACTTTEAIEPMLMVTTGDAGRTRLVVLDAHDRAITMRILAGAAAGEARTSDGGRSIAQTVGTVPDEVRIYDENGNEIARFHPRADDERAGT